MKKFFSFLILIALAWAGTTAWIGRQFPDRLEAYVRQMNDRMPFPNVAYRVASVKNGWRGAEVEIAIEARDKAGETIVATIPKTLRRLKWDVEYGPILFQKGLGVGLARLHTHIPYGAYRTLLANNAWVLLGDKGAIAMQARVGFDRLVHMEGHADRFVLHNNEANTTLRIEPVALRGVWDPWTYVGTYRMRTDAIGLNTDANGTLFKLEGVRIDANMTRRLSKYLIAGEGMFRADALHLNSPEGNTPLVLRPQMKMEMHEEANGTIGVSEGIDLHVIKGAFPGSATLIRSVGASFALQGLDRAALDRMFEMMRTWQEKQTELLQRLEKHPEAPETMAKLMALDETIQREGAQRLLALLRVKRTALNLHLEAARGEADETNEINATMRLIAPPPKGKPVAALQKMVARLPQYISLDANASLSSAFVQSLGPIGIRYTAMLEAGRKQGFVTRRNGRYTSSLHYTPTELILNGTPMPQVLMMVKMMGIGGLF